MSSAIVSLKKMLVRLLRDAVSLSFYIFLCFRKRDGALVLVYHSVDLIDKSKDRHRLNMTPESFEKHLKAISGYGRDVVITFDDGYRNNYERVFPLLRKYGLKASFFVVTDFIDGTIGPETICGEEMDLAPLTWEQIRIMDSAGFTIGSHSRTHPMLAGMARDAIREELSGSKRRIEESLGHEISDLAYPFGGYGSYDRTVMEVAEEAGYKRAYSNIMGINRDGGSDRYSLRRVRIYSEDGPFRLKMKLSGAYDWIDSLVNRAQDSSQKVSARKSPEALSTKGDT